MSESVPTDHFLESYPNQPMEYLREALKDSSINADVILTIVLDPRCGLECRSENGSTPLMLASLACRCDVMKALIAAAAEVNTKAVGNNQNQRRAPLHMVTMEGSLEAVALLIENGADVNATDVSFKLPLHLAAYYGHTACAELLIANGADVSAANYDGRTPLHHAAAEGYNDCAELLLSKGADVTATDKDGKTPLHLATYGSHLNCAKLLVSEGANVTAKDKSGNTPSGQAMVVVRVPIR